MLWYSFFSLYKHPVFLTWKESRFESRLIVVKLLIQQIVRSRPLQRRFWCGLLWRGLVRGVIRHQRGGQVGSGGFRGAGGRDIWRQLPSSHRCVWSDSWFAGGWGMTERTVEGGFWRINDRQTPRKLFVVHGQSLVGLGLTVKPL